MATQVELAQKGAITEAMREIAKQEGMEPELVRERFAKGRIVAPLNKNRPCRVVGMGQGMRTKINASIGTSTDLALFLADARTIRAERAPEDKQACTMCGQFCANQGSANLFGHLLSGTAKA